MNSNLENAMAKQTEQATIQAMVESINNGMIPQEVLRLIVTVAQKYKVSQLERKQVGQQQVGQFHPTHT